ncbi:MAG: hypothetical protein COT84_02090 [Chlamydiae bacterium CG10_big_fil_rev_8_21_14_0_10_35_9]|nr:MAG: hypothetical protein COT84_02090 [Chlamydiae bacterium CG10_big_fil_rev_8_21_14_0_10_35_9]
MSFILDFIFPTFCLHCGERIQKSAICPHCAQFLKLTSNEHFFSRLFEENPVTKLFVNYVKHHQFPEDIKTLSAFIILKIDQLNWDMPNKIEGNTPFTQKIAKNTRSFIRQDKKNIITPGTLLLAEEKELFQNNFSQVIII